MIRYISQIYFRQLPESRCDLVALGCGGADVNVVNHSQEYDKKTKLQTTQGH